MDNSRYPIPELSGVRGLAYKWYANGSSRSIKNGFFFLQLKEFI